MKKFFNFGFFSTIDAKRILSFLTTLFLLITAFLSLWMYIPKNINSDFCKNLVSIGTKSSSFSTPDVVKNMLHLSLPATSLTIEERSEVVPLENPAPPTLTESAVTPLNHVTYEDEGYKNPKGILLSNPAKKNINLESLLNKELDLSLTDEPSVLIIHTHTTESYTPSLSYNYTPTESYRTEDPRYNMIAVGEVIYQKLHEKGINVIHDKTVNDRPSYSQSYSNSLKLVNSYVEKYPSIKFVIDVHRDALSSGKSTLTEFDTESAQVMRVIGTNGSGLNHPNWESNLSFALKLQHRMNTLYPSLARPVNVRKERFNQHVAPYAFILEVGASSNTLDEAKKSAEYFSAAFLSLFKL